MTNDDAMQAGEIAASIYEAMTKIGKSCVVRYAKDAGAFEPVREHETDAGADLRAPHDFVLPALGSVDIDTGVHVQLPPMTKADVRAKSGLFFKMDIVVTECCVATTGLVDEGFSGSIGVHMVNLSDKEYHFERGDKVAQLVVSPVLYPKFELADEIDGGERGSNGYGSTGR